MDKLILEEVTEHNLKGFNLCIPKHKLIVITGVSGSGKSTLAFDVIYKEGQRRYLMAIHPAIKRFLPKFEKTKVKNIIGLSPTLGIKQQVAAFNPRSTVGTLTEIYDFLRILYTKVALPYCPYCNIPIPKYTMPEIIKKILSLPKGEKCIILAPIVIKGEKDWWKRYVREGFIKAKIDGHIYDLTEEIPPLTQKADIVVDRLIIKDHIKTRLRDSLELAFKLANGKVKIEILEKNKTLFFSLESICNQCGFRFPPITPLIFSFNNPFGACPVCQGIGEKEGKVCPACKGKRLKSEALAIKLNGKDIASISELPVKELLFFLKSINFSPQQKIIAMPILKEIEKRIKNLSILGIDYLPLNRPVTKVSTGEYQRLIIALYLTHPLSDVIFILDEPTTGLHPKEVEKLISILKILRDMGNTILIVEHDLQIISNADYIIELGPGAGEKGGKLIFSGTFQKFKKSNTITAQYLLGKKIYFRQKRYSDKYLMIEKATARNLKSITVSIPLNCFTCITGVSGSGKSALAIDVLYNYVKQWLAKKEITVPVKEIKGIENIKQVVLIDAQPIGRTHKSNPATYIGLFNHIRHLFANLPESKARGYTPEKFSLNTKGGRCEVCQGEGVIKIEMPLLPEVYLTCETCEGKRFNEEVLEIKFKGKNIAEVLEMTVAEAYEFFRHIPYIKKYLEIMMKVGLGYLQLGQPAPSLSGGEAQRLKLARELIKGNNNVLYILDEPSMGLHLEDIRKLLELLEKLLEKNNTIVIVEHHPEIIKAADYIIELGPGAGNDGGYLIKSGYTPPFTTFLPDFLASAK